MVCSLVGKLGGGERRQAGKQPRLAGSFALRIGPSERCSTLESIIYNEITTLLPIRFDACQNCTILMTWHLEEVDVTLE
jgi:hypothetical protein